MDQDLKDLTKDYINQNFRILYRAGFPPIPEEEFDIMVETVGQILQRFRSVKGFKYEPSNRPDAI